MQFFGLGFMTEEKKPHYEALLTSNIVPMYPAFKGIFICMCILQAQLDVRKTADFFACFLTTQMVPGSAASPDCGLCASMKSSLKQAYCCCEKGPPWLLINWRPTWEHGVRVSI